MILSLSFNSETEGSRECSASKGGDFIHLDGGFLAASWTKSCELRCPGVEDRQVATACKLCKLPERFWR